MKPIPTAAEFTKKHHPMKTYPVDWNVMVEFAKLHVKAALESANNLVDTTLFDNRESILESYPESNII